jgi:hypothetical protein
MAKLVVCDSHGILAVVLPLKHVRVARTYGHPYFTLRDGMRLVVAMHVLYLLNSYSRQATTLTTTCQSEYSC